MTKHGIEAGFSTCKLCTQPLDHSVGDALRVGVLRVYRSRLARAVLSRLLALQLLFARTLSSRDRG